jgi:hypothetical protein
MYMVAALRPGFLKSRDQAQRHYREIFPLGQQFMVIFANGKKMVLG